MIAPRDVEPETWMQLLSRMHRGSSETLMG